LAQRSAKRGVLKGNPGAPRLIKGPKTPPFEKVGPPQMGGKKRTPTQIWGRGLKNTEKENPNPTGV